MNRASEMNHLLFDSSLLTLGLVLNIQQLQHGWGRKAADAVHEASIRGVIRISNQIRILKKKNESVSNRINTVFSHLTEAFFFPLRLLYIHLFYFFWNKFSLKCLLNSFWGVRFCEQFENKAVNENRFRSRAVGQLKDVTWRVSHGNLCQENPGCAHEYLWVCTVCNRSWAWPR